MTRTAIAAALILLAVAGALGPPLPISEHAGTLLHLATGAVIVLALASLGLRLRYALLVVVAAACLLEPLQGCCLPGRSADPLDAAAGIAGAVAGAVITIAARRRAER
jgi:VanZ family protein